MAVIPAGYKQSEVGVIPEDWMVQQLGDIATIATGNTPPTRDASNYGDEFLFVSPADLGDGKHVIDTQKKLSTKGFALSRRFPKDSILFVSIGSTIGKCGVASIDLTTNQQINAIFPSHTFSTDYLYYAVCAVAHIIRSLAGEQAVPIVNKRQFSETHLPLPSLSEQHAIAAALSDVDALLAKLDQLIAKKRDLKQAAMQQLLTGQTRLPGFSGEWKSLQLGELIAHCASGATPYRGRPEYYDGNIKWITSGELNYNVITDTIEHISADAVEKTNLRIHPAGTFLMAITGLEAAGTRGACGIVGSPSTTNQSCMAIYPTAQLRTEFLYHYYVLRGDELALKYCQGTKQQSYTAKLVRLLPIDLPPTPEEQTAIATVLSDMDAELAALEARRDKTRALKQGMMQELLTGRIRLA